MSEVSQLLGLLEKSNSGAIFSRKKTRELVPREILARIYSRGIPLTRTKNKKCMEMNEFQKKALEFAIYPDQGNNLPYAIFGICGETGELAEKMKKLIRDKGGKLDSEYREEMAKELSDILWYVSTTARELGYTLDEIGKINIAKLTSRKERDKLKGSGDNR